MAVHYPKQLITTVRQAGLRLITIDCGSGLRYQGGCTPSEHMDLIRLIEVLTEADAARAAAQAAHDADPPLFALAPPAVEPPPAEPKPESNHKPARKPARPPTAKRARV